MRAYSPNKADEDWSFLGDRSKRNDFWDPLKYISLGGEGRYLTLSSEIRYRAEGFHLRGDASTPSTADGVYTTDLKLLLRAAVGQGKYVGANPGVVGVWQVTRHMTFQGAITRFVAGPFLEKTSVAGGFGFCSATLLYRL